MDTKQILLICLPLLIFNLVFVVLALRDLIKRKSVAGNNKILWALLILFVQFIGWISYFIFGRKDN